MRQSLACSSCCSSSTPAADHHKRNTPGTLHPPPTTLHSFELHRAPPLPNRLKHVERADLAILAQLTSIFVLTLTSPLLDDDGQVVTGSLSEVKVTDVERVVEELPFCDLELEVEPPGTD